MYKLTVVAGPNRGTSYAVQDGETSIGRQAGNTVVLPSAKVSKRHCVLVVSNGQVVVNDQGSSNGTFVNGTLAKSKPMRSGDRISVGEYVLELTDPPARAPRPAPAVAGLGGNVLQFPTVRPGGMQAIGQPGMAPGMGTASDLATAQQQQPKDLKGKLIWWFEHSLMPIFYNLNLKHEWRVICVGAFGALTVGNLVLSVYPLLEQNRAALVREMGKRAQFMARQIAERNAPLLAARAETKTEIGTAESAEGVRVAVLTDMDSRILAPATKLNQYLTTGGEATLAAKAKRLFADRPDAGGVVLEVDETTICAVEPVRVASQQAGRNVTVGMAVVSVDTSVATPGLGEIGMTYSETLILTGLLAGLVLVILFRLTLKPLQTLGEDMDRALKGEISQVTHEFKLEELDSLWDLINSALQRVPKGNTGIDGFGGSNGPTAEELSGPFRMLGQMSKYPLLVCDGDKKVLYMNPIFEEVSGIRMDNSVGQDIAAVARDQSLGQFVHDLFDRSQPGGDGISDDYDFSGVSYKVHASCVGSGSSKCYVLAATRVEG